MKKYISKIMLAALWTVITGLFLFTGEAKAGDSLIGKGSTNEYKCYDYADLVDDSAEAEIEDRLQEISDKYGVDVVVVTDVDRPSGSRYEISDELEATERYAVDFYADEQYYHSRLADDGMILMICTVDRSITIQSTGKLESYIDNSKRDSILDEMTTSLRNNDYESAIRTFAKETDNYLADYSSSVVRGWIFRIIIFVVIGFIIGLIRASALKSQLKSVAVKTEASDYIVPGSFNLRNSRDFFLYKTVTRVKRESSSSGGSHHSSGGRSFSGSSRHY